MFVCKYFQKSLDFYFVGKQPYASKATFLGFEEGRRGLNTLAIGLGVNSPSISTLFPSLAFELGLNKTSLTEN